MYKVSNFFFFEMYTLNFILLSLAVIVGPVLKSEKYPTWQSFLEEQKKISPEKTCVTVNYLWINEERGPFPEYFLQGLKWGRSKKIDIKRRLVEMARETEKKIPVVFWVDFDSMTPESLEQLKVDIKGLRDRKGCPIYLENLCPNRDSRFNELLLYNQIDIGKFLLTESALSTSEHLEALVFSDLGIPPKMLTEHLGKEMVRSDTLQHLKDWGLVLAEAKGDRNHYLENFFHIAGRDQTMRDVIKSTIVDRALYLGKGLQSGGVWCLLRCLPSFYQAVRYQQKCVFPKDKEKEFLMSREDISERLKRGELLSCYPFDFPVIPLPWASSSHGGQ
jgi:hypothetical protein